MASMWFEKTEVTETDPKIKPFIWSLPHCKNSDISTPFFLLVSFTDTLRKSQLSLAKS